MKVSVENLVKTYSIKEGFFGRDTKTVKAVNGVSFDLRPGEVLGVVGESGCGKSTLARTMLGLIPADSGEVNYDGKNMVTLSQAEKKALRKNVQVIFQDPFSSLNPRLRVFDIIAEPLVIHGAYKDREDLERQVHSMMESVGLSPEQSQRYPHEFSGGQRQRIGIARALSLRPSFVVADEPVSALDVSVQSQILNLLKDLQKDLGLTMVFIAHDLAVVEYISDSVAVMYLGMIVEKADVESFFGRPRHPYSKLLLEAIPRMDRERKNFAAIEGEIPNPINIPSGCPFHTRCPIATEVCSSTKPDWRNIGAKENPHWVACHHA